MQHRKHFRIFASFACSSSRRGGSESREALMATAFSALSRTSAISAFEYRMCHISIKVSMSPSDQGPVLIRSRSSSGGELVSLSVPETCGFAVRVMRASRTSTCENPYDREVRVFASLAVGLVRQDAKKINSKRTTQTHPSRDGLVFCRQKPLLRTKNRRKQPSLAPHGITDRNVSVMFACDSLKPLKISINMYVSGESHIKRYICSHAHALIRAPHTRMYTHAHTHALLTHIFPYFRVISLHN